MSSVRRILALSGASLIVLLSVFPGFGQEPKKEKAKPAAASSQTAVAVREIDTVALKELLTRSAERPLLVNFWATWCDPCRDEFPDLVKIDGDFRARGLDFITVSLDDLTEIKTEVPKFLVEMKATMPAYLLNVSDPEPAIKLVDTEWGGALPATFLYNQKGELVFKHFGRVQPTELRAAIEKLVGSKQDASGR